MQNFNEWVEANEHNEHINAQGGIDPTTDEQMKIFKKVDLITLPKDVSGTNCANCKFYEAISKKEGHCTNTQVQQNVNKRMCCSLWDNVGVIRKWVKKDK